MDVLHIFVILPDHWLLQRLQPVLSLLQCKLHHQQLLVSNVVIPLHQGQLPGEEGTGVNILILIRPLRQDCPPVVS